MISLAKDVLVRGFDDTTHSDLGKKADQMGVSINSIVKDAVDQWLEKKTDAPHVHDLLIYSDEKSMNNFLKSLDRMTSNTEWFKSFAAPPKHHSEKVLSKLDWFNGTVKPYNPHGTDGSKYCGRVMQNIAKESKKQPLCCVDFVITDVANPTRIHLSSCTRLKEDYFFEKMIENNGKYGLYLWYESIELAKQSHPDSVNCKFCNA